jgi:hypothetical protein
MIWNEALLHAYKAEASHRCNLAVDGASLTAVATTDRVEQGGFAGAVRTDDILMRLRAAFMLT